MGPNLVQNIAFFNQFFLYSFSLVYSLFEKTGQTPCHRGGIGGFWCLTSENLVRGDKERNFR